MRVPVIGQYTSPYPSMLESALGLLTASSFPAVVKASDEMLKASGVKLVGFEKVGSGLCTAVVRGKTADVRIAIEVGQEVAEREFGQFVSSTVIPRPLANLEAVLPIGVRLDRYVRKQSLSETGNQAIGLIETRGLPALLGACDAMLKSAEVLLIGYEKIGSGLCTAIIQGRSADVVEAIQVGLYAAQRIGEVHAIAVIPRPLDDLEQSLPLAMCMLEERQPLAIPTVVREPVADLVEIERQGQTPER